MSGDPLQLIRQATIAKTAVQFTDGHYVFGPHKIGQNTKTSFRRTHQRGGQYYTVREILFYLQYADAKISEYRQAAQKAGIAAVVTDDAKDLRRYLTGEIDTCEQIDASQTRISEPIGARVEELNAEQLQQLQQHRFESRKRRLEIPSDASFDSEFVDLDVKQLKSFRAHDHAAKTRVTVLRGAAEVDFRFVLKLFNDQVLKPPELQVRQQASADSRAGHERATGGSPIIIVPNSSASLISILNAADFLRDGVFISTDEKKAAGAKRIPELVIQRSDPTTGAIRSYKLVDNPAGLSAGDWDRVVAVFVTGQLWQIKSCKWQTPVELFRNVLGVFLTFDNRTMDPAVQTWNCKVIKVNQFQRHLDSSASLAFWSLLDGFIKVNKPHMLR